VDPQEVATFFGVMLLGAAVGTAMAASRPSTRSALTEAALPLAAAVAVGATAGSLYFSESAGFVPCELCWFQRIAMYPMSVILVLAALRRDRSVLPYALALSVIGLGISAYHIQLQLFPDQGSFCDATNPCTGRWVEAFGWMTIPQMAGLSFALIASLSALAILTPPKELP
jgi:disulfide bond formation protein DsbB